ncbi:MAG: hypothetical protein JXX28_06690 [Deltaproteobacteria bacterium]|nr:hypothetical protein [Deltaproteobacteria bacterium]
MRAWDIVDHEDLPYEDGTIYLMERGSEYVIAVNGRELMGNRMHGSEDALADYACDRLEVLDDAKVLVGGLGMGFTLAAVLRRIGPSGVATVAELMTAVVKWNRDYVGRAAKHPLRDPRVQIHLGDVAEPIETHTDYWSAILLDVDNGPQALTRPTNGWLYSDDGITVARNSLITGGILGIWSVFPDDDLTDRLSALGFDAEMIQFTEDGRPTPDDDGVHVLWMARKR